MAKKRTIVEINGRKYDTNTGQIVSETPTATPVIDGFKAPIPAQKKAPQGNPRSVNKAHSLHQKPQKTKKLHPAALKNPPAPKTVKSQNSTVQRGAVSDIHQPVMLGKRPSREERASQQTKSEHVKKFHAEEIEQTPAAVAVPAEDIVESPAPVPQPMPRPVVERPEPQAEPEQEPQQQKQSLASRLRQKRPRLVPAAITTVFVLAVGGYVAYQNVPNMALRVAASRAGFNASLPGYSPSGFGFAGPVAYSEGFVELEYTSNSDDRSFRLVQRESSWDSQSLLDNFVTAESDDYLTFQERGLTVYIYDTSNATWVDGGIWYTVEGNSLLSSEQLLKIAGSL